MAEKWEISEYHKNKVTKIFMLDLVVKQTANVMLVPLFD
jgi:hypothetical protein